jgi:hypothetical protein
MVSGVASRERWRLQRRQPTTRIITADHHLMEAPKIVAILIGLLHHPQCLKEQFSAWETLGSRYCLSACSNVSTRLVRDDARTSYTAEPQIIPHRTHVSRG